MKKVILMMAFAIGMTGAYAQKTVRVEKVKTGTEQAGNGEAEAASPEDETGKSPSTGDLFNGLTRPVTFDRMIPPYALEVTFNKTVHIIFPATIKYVDLGSADILAGKADGSENVLRVKAALRDFSRETNLAVITDDGSYYTFNVKYADEPTKLNIEMKDFLHDGEAVNRPNNAQEIYLSELGSESPLLVRLIMKSVYENNRRLVKHVGCKRFGIQYILKGIYTHNGLLHHLQGGGQESGETYRHSGAGNRAPACLQLCDGGKREEPGTHGIHAAQVHVAGRQAAHSGNERAERRATPAVHRHERRADPCKGNQRTEGEVR